MEWDDVRYLLAVYRAENLVAAARHLGVNQSTVTRRLQSIETALGYQLFYRNAGALIATSKMTRLLGCAERMEQNFARMKSSMACEGPDDRLVRINAMPWIVNHILLPALPGFFARYRDIPVEVIASVRDRNRLIRETDLSLRFELLPKRRELCQPIARVSYSLYSRADRASQDLRWIGFGADFDEFAPARWMRSRAEEQIVRVNDAGAMLVALQQGLGKGLLPDVLGRRAAGLARATTKGRAELTRTLRLLVHEDLARQKNVATVIKWLYETFDTKGLALPRLRGVPAAGRQSRRSRVGGGGGV